MALHSDSVSKTCATSYVHTWMVDNLVLKALPFEDKLTDSFSVPVPQRENLGARGKSMRLFHLSLRLSTFCNPSQYVITIYGPTNLPFGGTVSRLDVDDNSTCESKTIGYGNWTEYTPRTVKFQCADPELLDTLIFQFHLKFNFTSVSLIRYPVQGSTFSADFAQFFAREETDLPFTDFELRCQEETFKCHKAILAARSPMIKTMLGQNMKETQENCLALEDTTPRVVQALLKFIYSDRLARDNLQDVDLLLDLLKQGQFFLIPSLESTCLDLLDKLISPENISDIGLKAFVMKHTRLKKMIKRKSDQYRVDHDLAKFLAALESVLESLLLECASGVL